MFPTHFPARQGVITGSTVAAMSGGVKGIAASCIGFRMTVFQLKQLASHAADAAAGAVRWNYDRAEIIADGVVHGLGVGVGLVAATALIVLAGVFAATPQIVSVSIYAAGLLTMLGFSAAYNMWPVSPRKWWLRRFDHAAIYLLIAATYTPFMMQMSDRALALSLLAVVWGVAVVGVALKLLLPGRFDRLSIALYLALGWSGLAAYDAVFTSLPAFTLGFVVAGGALYTFGVIFHTWRRLRFQNAIWHGFVLLGAACHYTAVLDLVLT